MSELGFGKVKGGTDFFLSGPARVYDQASGLSGETKHILRIPKDHLSWLAMQALLALPADEREFVLVGVEEVS